MSDTYDLAKAGFDAALGPLTGTVKRHHSKNCWTCSRGDGLTLQDRVKTCRFEQRLRLFKKTQEIIERSGLEPRRVPRRLLASILDNAGLEEDDSLQGMWAALLANSATGKYHEIMFPEVLR